MHTPEFMMNQLNETEHSLLPSQLRELKADQVKRLLQKLSDDPSFYARIEVQDTETLDLLERAYALLLLCFEQNLANNVVKKDYVLTLRALTKALHQKYRWVPKGYLIGQYIGIGLLIGAGLGIVFFSNQPNYYALGSTFGLIAGVSYGNAMENRLKRAGLLY